MLFEAFGRRSRHKLSLVTSKQSLAKRQPRPLVVDQRLVSDIREVRTREDKEQLYRFRYRVAGETPGQVARHLDHASKSIFDEMDASGVHLVVLLDAKPVGAVRINYAWRSALGLQADFFRMRETAGPDHPSRTCIISRLIVDPGLRGKKLGYHLLAAAYKHALQHDARIAYMSCIDDLIFYFSVLGFKAYMGRTRHAEYGEVLPMKLDLLDEKYLMMIDSPLLPVLRGWKQSKQPSVEIRPL